MRRLTNEHYQKIVGAIEVNDHEFVKELIAGAIFRASFKGYVVPKGRPRAGASGVFYTPANTKRFEADVRSWCIANYPYPAVFFPISVDLTVYDAYPMKEAPHDRWLKKNGFVVKQHGDLDNKEKAITDAMNGIVYKDDKQIVSVNKRRRYSTFDGFDIVIRRAGLSKNEVENLKKIK